MIAELRVNVYMQWKLFWCWSRTTRFALHAFTEPGQSAGLLLVAALPEPALYGPHIPVQLLGQAFQPLLIWMLATQGPQRSGHLVAEYKCYKQSPHMHHLGYSSEDLLQDSIRLCLLWTIGLDLQAHCAWSRNKPAMKRSKMTFRAVQHRKMQCKIKTCLHGNLERNNIELYQKTTIALLNALLDSNWAHDIKKAIILYDKKMVIYTDFVSILCPQLNSQQSRRCQKVKKTFLNGLNVFCQI